MSYNGLGRRENVFMTAQKLTESLKRLVGENHIRVFASALDTFEYVVFNYSRTPAFVPVSLQQEMQQALEMRAT